MICGSLTIRLWASMSFIHKGYHGRDRIVDSARQRLVARLADQPSAGYTVPPTVSEAPEDHEARIC